MRKCNKNKNRRIYICILYIPSILQCQQFGRSDTKISQNILLNREFKNPCKFPPKPRQIPRHPLLELEKSQGILY